MLHHLRRHKKIGKTNALFLPPKWTKRLSLQDNFPCPAREARQNPRVVSPFDYTRNRERAPERKRTRNENIIVFGYVHVYAHEHVHVAT